MQARAILNNEDRVKEHTSYFKNYFISSVLIKINNSTYNFTILINHGVLGFRGFGSNMNDE